MILSRDNTIEAACGTTGYLSSEQELEKLRDVENFSGKKRTAMKTPAKLTENWRWGGSVKGSSQSREKQCKKRKVKT